MIETPLAITPGEPAGIGPDILLNLLNNNQLPCNIHVFADRDLLNERARLLGISDHVLDSNNITIKHIPLKAPVTAGHLSIENSQYVLETLTAATSACQNKHCRALVTGPVHKGILTQSGIPFTGHTEFLAKLTNAPLPVMLLTSPALSVALLTTHIPLSDVPGMITEARISQTITILHQALETRFQIPSPTIVVCGLNPHAGEDGTLGREEIDTIIPALTALRTAGMKIIGPVSADTAFTNKTRDKADAILAMYHDQGLGPLKTLGFGEAVNITLGLPILRTSVDHGVALDLAGTNQASPDSLLSAIQMAHQLSQEA